MIRLSVHLPAHTPALAQYGRKAHLKGMDFNPTASPKVPPDLALIVIERRGQVETWCCERERQTTAGGVLRQ